MEEQSPKPASTPQGAVFLSYASQDSDAAKRICDALRAAGVDVWFDQSELRGGDLWDRKIRRQIHECTLFIPVISANTAARHEGYFRLEWDLADQRTHMIARNRVFVLPVCLDATPEVAADAPESFQRVQWTRLPAGETPAAFVERVRRLLSPGPSTPTTSGASTIDTVAGEVPAASRAPPFWRRQIATLLVIAAIAVVAGGYIALERLVRSKPTLGDAASNSIAVLPLKNESGDPSQQYFSDGLSEDLITALSQFPGLKVIGRTSSFQFRDAKDDARTIGSKLGVARLLEGSVRRAGGMVRVSAELINTSDGTTQWSDRYDRPYKDLFALQDDLTRAVASALKARLLPGERPAAQTERPPSGSLAAYNELLQAKFYDARDTEADLRKSIEHYTAATQLDPRYALAWSNLSRGWAGLGAEFLDGAPAQAAYAKARAAADTALSLAPDLPAAHVARGYLLQIADFDQRGAEAEYRRALTLAPEDAQTKLSLGNQLATLGEVGKAAELTREALSTDPLRADWYNWLATYLLTLDRTDEAKSAIDKAIDLEPKAAGYHQVLAMIEIKRGDAPAALAAAQHEAEGVWQDYALALARQIGSDPAAADAALKNLIDKNAAIASYQVAQVYALRHDVNSTFDWLERAWANRDPGVTALLFDPFIGRYRDDPRFAAFCRKVGLPVPGDRAGS
jgi:TolB-like protein/Tfp pilus assembly protein PilF